MNRRDLDRLDTDPVLDHDVDQLFALISTTRTPRPSSSRSAALTGFDATTLNTLWADKNLRADGLIGVVVTAPGRAGPGNVPLTG